MYSGVTKNRNSWKINTGLKKGCDTHFDGATVKPSKSRNAKTCLKISNKNQKQNIYIKKQLLNFKERKKERKKRKKERKKESREKKKKWKRFKSNLKKRGK